MLRFHEVGSSQQPDSRNASFIIKLHFSLLNTNKYVFFGFMLDSKQKIFFFILGKILDKFLEGNTWLCDVYA